MLGKRLTISTSSGITFYMLRVDIFPGKTFWLNVIVYIGLGLGFAVYCGAFQTMFQPLNAPEDKMEEK